MNAAILAAYAEALDAPPAAPPAALHYHVRADLDQETLALHPQALAGVVADLAHKVAALEPTRGRATVQWWACWGAECL